MDEEIREWKADPRQAPRRLSRRALPGRPLRPRPGALSHGLLGLPEDHPRNRRPGHDPARRTGHGHQEVRRRLDRHRPRADGTQRRRDLTVLLDRRDDLPGPRRRTGLLEHPGDGRQPDRRRPALQAAANEHLEQDRGDSPPHPQRPAGRDPLPIRLRRPAPPEHATLGRRRSAATTAGTSSRPPLATALRRSPHYSRTSRLRSWIAQRAAPHKK